MRSYFGDTTLGFDGFIARRSYSPIRRACGRVFKRHE